MIVTFFSVLAATANGSDLRLFRSTNLRLLFFARFVAPVVLLFGCATTILSLHYQILVVVTECQCLVCTARLFLVVNSMDSLKSSFLHYIQCYKLHCKLWQRDDRMFSVNNIPTYLVAPTTQCDGFASSAHSPSPFLVVHSGRNLITIIAKLFGIVSCSPSGRFLSLVIQSSLSLSGINTWNNKNRVTPLERDAAGWEILAWKNSDAAQNWTLYLPFPSASFCWQQPQESIDYSFPDLRISESSSRRGSRGSNTTFQSPVTR